VLVDIYLFSGEGEDPYHWTTDFSTPHPVHSMIEVTRAQVPTTPNPQRLRNRQFYSIGSIHRSAHVIPVEHGDKERPSDRFYINNFIDFDEY
jgi:hypothetical protein